MDMDTIYEAAAAKWDRIPKGALDIGCHGCVAATSVYCASCPVRGRRDRRLGINSLEKHRAGIDLMPKARLRHPERRTDHGQ